MERKIIAEKHMPGHNIYKGKKTISLEEYELLAKRLFESGEKRDIFTQ